MAACITCVINMVIWPLPPAVFTYHQQRPDVDDGAVPSIKLVFHHLLHIAACLLGPIHPQQPIQKVGNVNFMVLSYLLLMFCGSTGLKHNIHDTTAITALSPHSRDVRRAGRNRRATDNR
jgi:hypothetical protein